MPHRPLFALRTSGGVCAGEQWICDGEEPIACLTHALVAQPEQNLRYFNQNLKPLELRQLVLSPGQDGPGTTWFDDLEVEVL